ncbi:hypothetical protein CWD68_00895 [Campylobacter jejuni]|nr:hypothetical protein [Campylobacter jejuni]
MKEWFLLFNSLVFFMLWQPFYAFLKLKFFAKSIFIGFILGFAFLGFLQTLKIIFDFYIGL